MFVKHSGIELAPTQVLKMVQPNLRVSCCFLYGHKHHWQPTNFIPEKPAEKPCMKYSAAWSVSKIEDLCFSVLQVFPMTSSGGPITEYPFIRTGLLGFIGPGGLVFVIGKMDGLMVVSGRRHNADDIVATALAVEPMKFVYRGRFDLFFAYII